MTAPVSIDFECRSGTDIALGLPRYFADREAAPLCMAYDFGDGLGTSLWVPPTEAVRLATLDGRYVGRKACPPDLADHVRSGGMIRAWNAAFEHQLWNTMMVPQFDWPPLAIEQCIDSMAEAAAMNLPQALGRCAIALELPEDLQKDKRGNDLIKLLCIPQGEPVVKAPVEYSQQRTYKAAKTKHLHWLEHGGRWRNDPDLLRELYAYCIQDVRVEMAILSKLRRLSPYEQRVWVLTQEINMRGVPIDTSEIRRISRVVDIECDHLNTELYELTGGRVGSAAKVSQLRDWVNSLLPEDYQLPDLTAETVDAALLQFTRPGWTVCREVYRALQIRAAIGQTSTAKLPKMLRVVAGDDTLKNMHVYHGASTGRDASRGGVNLQNLKRPILDAERAIDVLRHGDHEFARWCYGDQLMDAAVSSVRGVIKAPRGFEFMDGDFSSVENRVSAWIAGQEDKLDLFRAGLDEYKTYATRVFNITYEEVTKGQRTFCKPPVLGGMFGLGAVSLVNYAAGMGVYLTLGQAQNLIDIYRSEYEKVKYAWWDCGDASLRAVGSPKKWVKCGEAKLSLISLNNFLWMKLPSGRNIAWAAPRIENKLTPWGEYRDVVTVMQVDAFSHQWKRDKLIGSSIFQSGVQATARDLLMHGMFRVEEAGYRVVLRVHDELLSLVRKGYGSLKEYIALLCTVPSWAPDLPLAGEGWVGPRFQK